MKRLDNETVIRFLENHNAEWTRVPEGIRTFVWWTGPNGTSGKDHKTFNKPTVKEMRDWLGY